jgi:hypothetical protein
MRNAGKVTTGFSMSLDGFVAGPNEDFQHLFAWMTSGDTEYTLTIARRSKNSRSPRKASRGSMTPSTQQEL